MQSTHKVIKERKLKWQKETYDTDNFYSGSKILTPLPQTHFLVFYGDNSDMGENQTKIQHILMFFHGFKIKPLQSF